MAVRDLGYAPYEGARLPASRNGWVLFRFGLRRAWSSFLVRLATVFFWVPGAVAVGLLVLRSFMLANAADPATATEAMPLDGPRLVADTIAWTVWLVAGLVTLGAGAGAISLDLAHRSLPFFLAKPVTPTQYLLGRVGAVAAWLFALLVANAAIAVAGLVGLGEPALRLEHAGLMFPATLHAVVACLTLAAASVGISALSPSRATTMGAWVFAFVAPTLVGALVSGLADWPWFLLASLPATIRVVGDALYKIAPGDALRWWHALPALLAISGALLALAHRRVRTAEVVR